MMKNCLALIIFLWVQVISTYGFKIDLNPSDPECFYVDLKEHEMFLISYDVVEGGDQMVDFLLYNTYNVLLQETNRKKDGYYSYNATTPGLHKYCFRNQLVTKKLTFSPYVQKMPSEKDLNTGSVADELWKMEDYINKIESEIYFVSSLGYSHDQTSKVTANKIYWWTIFQTISVIGICIWQVYYLKTFFENRRVV